jgi:hypothetical protein
MCYANGLEDILAWKGRRYLDYLIPVVGGTASFAYLRFDRAVPPRQVYWGANPKYFFLNLEGILGFRQVISEGKAFKSTMARIKKDLDAGNPLVAGALDMFYLSYYPGIYRESHIPIHYLLVVGYDDDRQTLLVQDCSRAEVQSVPYDEFRQALDVKVPGMSLRNTIRVFETPATLPDELGLAAKGFETKARQMLSPPVSLLGIPAMRKLADDLPSWDDRIWFEHLVTYATVPPQLPSSFERSDGMRFMQAGVLAKLSIKYGVPEWSEAASLFEQSAFFVIELCKSAMQTDGETCSSLMSTVADLEQRAYGTILDASVRMKH